MTFFSTFVTHNIFYILEGSSISITSLSPSIVRSTGPGRIKPLKYINVVIKLVYKIFSMKYYNNIYLGWYGLPYGLWPWYPPRSIKPPRILPPPPSGWNPWLYPWKRATRFIKRLIKIEWSVHLFHLNIINVKIFNNNY